jgi:hypothetical protein
MPWWSWVLIWLALLVGAGLFFFLLARSLWRQTKELGKEVATASERFGAIDAQLEQLSAANADQPAIFADPVQVRMDQAKTARTLRSTRQRVR